MQFGSEDDTARAGTMVRDCLVDDCSWTSTEHQVEVRVYLSLAGTALTTRGASGESNRRLLDDVVRAEVLRSAADVEAEVLDHLRRHDVVDFARTIHRLRGEVEALRTEFVREERD